MVHVYARLFFCFLLCLWTLQVPEEVVVGEEFPVTVSLVNPLPINLVSPRFIVQGAGMGRAQKSKLTR